MATRGRIASGQQLTFRPRAIGLLLKQLSQLAIKFDFLFFLSTSEALQFFDKISN